MREADFIQQLGEAAARGVEVTIITNTRSEPRPWRYRWTYEEKWWGAIARYRGAGFELYVTDKDGDMSEWNLKRGKQVLAEGGTYECKPLYHFDACMLAAEAALDAEVKRRLERLRSAP